ncbi:MAG: flagellar biosynthesis protein FlhB [Gammaproteobacteria bacterium]|nr:MAG: flagellar biosynthesis protein FlhB [Gammaproteobacteria bacterium]
MPSENKTEKPTPRRIQRAKEEGNVPKSLEVNSVAILLTGLTLLWFFGSKIFEEFLFSSFKSAETFISPQRLNSNDVLLFWEYNLEKVFVWLFLLLLTTLLIAIISNIAQFGVVFTSKPLGFKFERLNPINGLKNIFFSLNGLFELIKNLLKIAVIIGIAYFFVNSHLEEILSLYRLPIEEGLSTLSHLLLTVSGYIIAVGALIAVIDYSFKRWKWLKDLMMTREELKEELKQTEGNPEVKRELRRRMRQIATRRMMQEVPKATVVITNPTHYAVALKYDINKDNAPKVVAKGVDNLAKRIIETAKQHGVEIYRDPPLARALYTSVEVGQEIPEKFYRAVAKIIAYVLSKKRV